MLRTRTIVTLTAALLTIAGPSHGNGGGSVGSDPITDVEIEDLRFMREEEKLARETYLVLGEEWGLAIFSNIAESEHKHMAALEQLIDKSRSPIGTLVGQKCAGFVGSRQSADCVERDSPQKFLVGT